MAHLREKYRSLLINKKEYLPKFIFYFKQKRILVKPEAKLVKSTHVIACEGIHNYQYKIVFKEHHMLVPKDDLVQTIKYASVTMQCI